jgi:hypothetical protein
MQICAVRRCGKGWLGAAYLKESGGKQSGRPAQGVSRCSVSDGAIRPEWRRCEPAHPQHDGDVDEAWDGAEQQAALVIACEVACDAHPVWAEEAAVDTRRCSTEQSRRRLHQGESCPGDAGVDFLSDCEWLRCGSGSNANVRASRKLELWLRRRLRWRSGRRRGGIARCGSMCW